MMSLQTNFTKPLILFFPFDLLSHYLRCLELAKHLTKDFEILFAHSNAYSKFVLEQEFKTFPCKNFDAAKVTKCAQKFDFSWLDKDVIEDIFQNQVQIITQYKPDIVFGDVSPSLRMAAEKTGVKYVSLMNGYMSKYYAHVRKISITHPAYKYSKKLPENIFNFITQTAESLAFKKVHKPFRIIRKDQGLSSKRTYLDELEGELNLICDLEDVFPQKNLPANYRIISPLFHSSGLPPSGITNKLNKSKKTMFVSMGSSGDWSKVNFLNDSYFEKYNVVSAGDKSHVLNARHIINLSFINVDELFPSTDLVICHGGNGTIYQALSYGIPVLCKTAHFEQEWNAHGFEKAGFGPSLNEINSDAEVKTTIDFWINMKNSERLMYVKDKIKKEKTELENREIAQELSRLIVTG